MVRTKEQKTAAWKAYLKNRVFIGLSRSEATKFGAKVTPTMTNKEIANAIKDKFGIVRGAREGGSREGTLKMIEVIKTTGLKVPEKSWAIKSLFAKIQLDRLMEQ